MRCLKYNDGKSDKRIQQSGQLKPLLDIERYENVQQRLIKQVKGMQGYGRMPA